MHCTISKPETFVFSAIPWNGFCWNYLYLTRQVEAARTPEERNRLLRMISVHSPQSWAHFNMLGEYNFSSDRLQNNTGVLPPKTEPRIIPENWEPPNR